MKIGILIKKVDHIFTNGCVQQSFFILNILRNCAFDVEFISKDETYSQYELSNEKITHISDSFDFSNFNVILLGSGMLHTTDTKLVENIKTHCVKVIHLVCGNYYYLFQEDFVFNVHAEMQQIMNVYHDEIWVLEMYASHKSFLELIFDVPVTIMPYVWTPYFIKSFITMKALPLLDFECRKPMNREKINICIFEPNVSIHKNSFIPLHIANRYYELYGERLHRVYLFCSKYEMRRGTRSLSICKDNKIEFLGKHIMLEMVDLIMKNNDYINVVVSHNINNNLNFIHLEFLHLGIPCIHNSEPFATNQLYYSDEMNAISLIEKTRLTFDLKSYRDLASNMIKKYDDKNHEHIEKYSYQYKKSIM